MSISEERIAQIVKEVTAQVSGGSLATGGSDDGIFEDINLAIEAAKKAQKELMAFSLEKRESFICAMRQAARDNAEKLSIMANEETGYGRVPDKIAKHLLVANKTPGTEDLTTAAFTGDNGLTLEEYAPYGVIGAITPSTNPTATIVNNSIGMVAAGNAVVFNPHPAAKKCTAEAIRVLNRAIVAAGGPANLLVAPVNPTMDTSKVIMTSPVIKMLAVTGGEAVVAVAMKSGKKCVCAGPGNPPVIVDETANIKEAAKNIVAGASYDNNILCIAEKEILVVESVADELIREMVKCGCYLANRAETQKVVDTVVVTSKEGKSAPNKKFVGKNANVILDGAGIAHSGDNKLVIMETDFDHVLVHTEMLMPVVPVVRVKNVEEAIAKAVIAEHGCHHTAMMHSENVNNLTAAARALDTTIFVKNAPSYAGVGFNGEGYTTLTISTPTGEGLTSARNFSRVRRCTMYGAFRIV